MFGLFRRLPRTKPRASERQRLSVEQLEARDCPSALAIPAFSTQVLPGHKVVLTGSVSGANAAGTTVNFSGAVTGSVTADANGNYTFTTTATAAGTVTAVAVDTQNDACVPVSAPIVPTAPTITLAVTAVSPNSYLLSGTVTDVDAAGEIVSITGAMTGTATTDANGNFSFKLPTSNLGTVDVSTTDLWARSPIRPR